MKPSCYQRTFYGPMSKKGTERATWDPQQCWIPTGGEHLFSLGPQTSQALPSRQLSPSFLAPGTSFMEDNFPTNQAWGHGLGMIRANCHRTKQHSFPDPDLPKGYEWKLFPACRPWKKRGQAFRLLSPRVLAPLSSRFLHQTCERCWWVVLVEGTKRADNKVCRRNIKFGVERYKP